MKRFISITLTTLTILFMAWVFMSWIDIVADNSTQSPTHSDYNFFIVATNLVE